MSLLLIYDVAVDCINDIDSGMEMALLLCIKLQYGNNCY
jgi:hypothetical protein